MTETIAIYNEFDDNDIKVSQSISKQSKFIQYGAIIINKVLNVSQLQVQKTTYLPGISSDSMFYHFQVNNRRFNLHKP